MRKFVLLIVFALCSISRSSAQAKMIRTLPMSARLLQVDELGNAYVVRNDNSFIKYSPEGDSIANYISIANGDISDADVTNPLRILLYYAKFAKLVLLDRMLAPKNELNLRKQNQLNAKVIAVSAEGNLWVYDQLTATLNKLDMNLNIMIQGNDLRQQLSELPQPVYLTERDRKVYMADTSQGILVFDQYGTYINTLPLQSVKKLQVEGEQLIYRKKGELIAYHIPKFETTKLALPELPGSVIIDAAFCRNTLYVLYNDRLVYYRIGN